MLQGRCDASDPYWSHDGVVRALTENAADVSLTLLCSSATHVHSLR